MFHLSEYLEHLRALGRAPTTIRQHGGTITRFCVHVRREGGMDTRGVTESLLGGYLTGLRASAMSPDRYRQVVVRLRDFFAFLVENGQILISPLAERAVPRYHRSSASVPVGEGVSALLERVRTDRPFYLKGKAIMELAYSSALRPREVYGLEVTDLDAKGGQLFIRESKSRKDRVVPVGPTAVWWTRRYIDEVRPLYLRGRSHGRVFTKHHSGAPENQAGIASAVSRTLRASGLPTIRPSAFRAIAATDLHRSGMHLVHISRLLGHSDINTTQRYVRLQEMRLAAVLAEHHPRRRFEIGGDE